MKRKLKILPLIMLVLTSLSWAQLELPLTGSKCWDAGTACGLIPCLIADWGPGNGSNCRVQREKDGQIGSQNVFWGCDGNGIEVIVRTHQCYCEQVWVADLAISINPSTCVPASNTVFFPYSVTCG